jgi:L-fuculose-phosphate aldolase
MSERKLQLEFDMAKDKVALQCRRVGQRGLAPARSGNVSMSDGAHVFITRSGLRLEDSTASDISVVSYGGDLLEGRRPSSELQLHLALHAKSDVKAVVHIHGGYSTAVGLVVSQLPLVHYAILELGRGGFVPTIPYFVFGSQELADAVAAQVDSGCRAVLMRNHGAVAIGESLSQAVENAELIEWIAEVYCRARQLGEPSLLTSDELDEVSRQFERLEYGS